MPWPKKVIEEIAEKRLVELLGTRGESRYARYIDARKVLVEQVLKGIPVELPGHTDHGEDHVSRVIDNVASLIGLENADSKIAFSPLELYCLLLSALFHDVGNIFGREEHQKKVAEVYDYIFPEAMRDMPERKIILAVTAAHCGSASDGTKDTLREIMGTMTLDRREIKASEIAAVLRLADELEEGFERTSNFMQKFHKIPPESEIFHRYSDAVEPYIDRGGKRIALTYNINIDTGGTKKLSPESEQKLRELLEYVYVRISKLNQERKYATFYCESALRFKETTVAFYFMVDRIPVKFDLPPRVILSDLTVPGEHREKTFVEYDAAYKTDNVLETIRKNLEETHS